MCWKVEQRSYLVRKNFYEVGERHAYSVWIRLTLDRLNHIIIFWIWTGIYIRIHGFGHCEWPHYDHRNPADKTTEGNETYIDERIYVVGNRASDAGECNLCKEFDRKQSVVMRSMSIRWYTCCGWNVYISIWMPITNWNSIVARNWLRLDKIHCEFGAGSTIVANSDTRFPIQCHQTVRFEHRCHHTRTWLTCPNLCVVRCRSCDSCFFVGIIVRNHWQRKWVRDSMFAVCFAAGNRNRCTLSWPFRKLDTSPTKRSIWMWMWRIPAPNTSPESWFTLSKGSKHMRTMARKERPKVWTNSASRCWMAFGMAKIREFMDKSWCQWHCHPIPPQATFSKSATRCRYNSTNSVNNLKFTNWLFRLFTWNR